MVQESFISTQEILYSPDVMYLNIIIVDENDNFPIFIHPNEKEQKIGYPEAELAHDVLPPYLFRVEVWQRTWNENFIIFYYCLSLL